MSLFNLAIGASFGWNTTSYNGDTGYDAFLNGKAC